MSKRMPPLLANAATQDDIFIVQRGIVSKGVGDDRYILAPGTVDSGTEIKLTDSEGTNWVHFIDNLDIVTTRVARDAVQLTLSNGSVITILGASQMLYETGGNPLENEPGTIWTYDDFVYYVLGIATGVPDSGVVQGGPVTIGIFPEPSNPVPQEPVDDHGDTFESATDLASEYVTGELETSSDTDMFRVVLEAGKQYQFNLNSTSDMDPVLSLYGAAGTLIASNDDTNGRDSQITFTATESGIHYLSVESWGGYSSGSYELIQTELVAMPVSGFDYQLNYTNASSLGYDFTDVDAGIRAALDYWGQFLDTHPNANLGVEINYVPQAGNVLASAGPNGFTYAGYSHNGLPVYDTNVQSELLTGFDDTYGDDLVINIATADMSLWWFDPTPMNRHDNAPAGNQLDFVGVMMHEFAHALGFLSFYGYPAWGDLQNNYGALTTFDQFISYNASKTEFYFTGYHANQAYMALGGADLLPVYAQPGQEGSSLSHYDGMSSGSSLLTGMLMNPVATAGVSMDISEIDLAILQDLGYAIRSSSVGLIETDIQLQTDTGVMAEAHYLI
jgi:hypothetical protein